MSRLIQIVRTYFTEEWKQKNAGDDRKKETDQTTGTLAKVMQYLMLIFLFGLAFFLPGYGLKKQAREQAASRIMQQETEQRRQGDPAESLQTTEQQTVQDSTPADTGESPGTIVLDAGHGGEDPGMTGSSGISEKVLNLVYVKKLAELLEQEGYRVVLTRTTEDGLYDADQSDKKAQDMQRRCGIIEEADPLVTVSIHQNSYTDPAVYGPQVFYYAHSTEGEKLAAMIQDCMNEQLAVERPRVQKGNDTYYILKNSASITVLVEVGFLSNPQEEQLLQDESYQDRAVRAVCDGILQYLQGQNVQ